MLTFDHGESRPGTLRDRTRRAVRKEIADVAHTLFIARGYKSTTVEDIAAAVGLSQRSVFRYFPTKEDVVLGKLDYAVDDMLSVLRKRPRDESAWASLRRMFDVLVLDAHEPANDALTATILQVILGTAALFGQYLQKLQQMQDAIVAVLRDRADAAGTPCTTDDPALPALTAAAFGCLVVAQRSWLANDGRGSLSDAVDRTMATICTADRLSNASSSLPAALPVDGTRGAGMALRK